MGVTSATGAQNTSESARLPEVTKHLHRSSKLGKCLGYSEFARVLVSQVCIRGSTIHTHTCPNRQQLVEEITKVRHIWSRVCNGILQWDGKV